MSNLLADSLLAHFNDLEDPRHKKGKIHDLKTILTIALVAMICGCDEWTEIEQFGKLKKSLFVNIFGVARRGIPSHDTFDRLFAIIKLEPFQACFQKCMKALAQIVGQISIDGKALRGSHDSFSEQLHRYVVSAYANESGLVLAQVATDKKSNEITAIPQLLKLLDLEGCAVTMDAMGTQTAIVEQIVSAGADYVLALKGNQSELNKQVRENFEK